MTVVSFCVSDKCDHSRNNEAEVSDSDTFVDVCFFSSVENEETRKK